MTKKRREFANWPFNEIVKGFDEQRSAFIGETIFQLSMLTLHVEDLWHNKATEVLRFIIIPEYPQLFSSAQNTQSNLTMWSVGLRKPLGNYGGMVMNNQG